jgi:Ca-activated chloride channel family protein
MSSSPQGWQTSQSPQGTGQGLNARNCLLIGVVLFAIACACSALLLIAGNSLWDRFAVQPDQDEETVPVSWPADSAELTIAVSPGMSSALGELADQFNRQQRRTPDDQAMQVQILALAPEKMVEQSLGAPSFQALAPDSSLWLNQLEQRWAELTEAGEESLVPIGNRRVGTPVRYATSPIVIAAWESVARDLGWPERPIGWQQIQQQATADPNFKWNHPSTGYASGLLATLAEFYAGAGLTRGLTPEAATDPQTLEYVRAVEATVRFYGEGEEVIVERLAAEGRDFLDAFVTQEQVVIAWNQHRAQNAGEELVAIYPAEGTLWADHPLALLELGGPRETSVTDNQRRTFEAFAQFLSTADVQRHLLAAGYRPADLTISLDEPGNPFASTGAVDWRQPQTTLQIPSAMVVEVVQNVWWYTKRPTNVYLVVDTSGSMQGVKIRRTQEALQAFVGQIQGDRDQVGLIEFGSGVKLFEPLQALDDASRQELIQRINRMEADGQTAMIDAVLEAYDDLQRTGNTEAINAIVVMTDGLENASYYTIDHLRARFEEEQAVTVVVFAIAFGNDADAGLLREIADIGGGQFRRADETDIEELYKVISTYF